MDIRFVNGSTVHRAWGDDSSELLAGFQYETDAIQFARTKLAEDSNRNWRDSFYVVHETCSGKMTIVRHKPEAKAA